MIDNEARSSCGVNSKVKDVVRQDDESKSDNRARTLAGLDSRRTDSASTQVCAQRQRQKTRGTIVDTTSTTTRDEVTK